MDSGAERIEAALAETLTSMKSPTEKEELLATMSYDIERLKNHEYFQEMHKYVGFMYEEPASLLDYLSRVVLLIMDEINRIKESATSLDKEVVDCNRIIYMVSSIVELCCYIF